MAVYYCMVWPSWNIILCLVVLRVYSYIFLAFHVLDRLQAQVGLGIRLRLHCGIIHCSKIFACMQPISWRAATFAFLQIVYVTSVQLTM